jgi:FkbM family methyltransferase
VALTETKYGKFFYFLPDCIGREVASGKFLDDWLRPYIDLLGPGKTLIDVGASIGFFTVYAAKKGAKVHAFEPSIELFDLLKRNCEMNGVSENVTLYNVPLYDKEIELWLETKLNQYPSLPDGRIDYENTGNSSVCCLIPKEVGTKPCASYKFVCKTLDSFALPVDVLKIDTQGCDVRVLLGAKDTIRKCRPVVCFEHEPDLLSYHGDSFDGFINLFEELHYKAPVYIGGVDYVFVPMEAVK